MRDFPYSKLGIRGELRAVSLFRQIRSLVRFSKGSARARERRSRETRARGYLRVSRFARQTTEKRETARSLDSRILKAKSGQDLELKPYGRGGRPKITIENTGLGELRDLIKRVSIDCFL